MPLSRPSAVSSCCVFIAVCVHLCGCDHSLLSDAHLGNQRLVTRELGGVPGKNHLGGLKSTGPECSAARKSRPAGPGSGSRYKPHCSHKFQSLPATCHALKPPCSWLNGGCGYVGCWHCWSALAGLVHASVLVIHRACELSKKNHEKCTNSMVLQVQR